MSNPIPVFIAALHLTKLSFTHSFKYKAWSRNWYGPNSPLLPPCYWNYYLYINLMHFSAHFTGPYRCGAVISSSFPPFLTPCLFLPVFSNQPFLPPPSHSNNNKISFPSHHLTKRLHPPTLPSLVPNFSSPHHHISLFSKPFAHNTQCT